MSVYSPPSFEEYLSVFNPADWIASSSSSGNVDVAFLDANYLKFPNAQGTENLQNVNIGSGNSITFASDGSSFTTARTTWFVNPYDYGFRTTASTATNTTALQNAINALPVRGGVIFIGSGIYSVGAVSITSKENFVLIIQGELNITDANFLTITNCYNFTVCGGGSLYLQDLNLPPNNDLITIVTNAGAPRLMYKGVMRICDLTFSYGTYYRSAINLSGIVEEIFDLFIERCNFNYCIYAIYRVSANTGISEKGLHIVNNMFNNLTFGININAWGGEINITNNSFVGNTYYPIVLNNPQTSYQSVTKITSNHINQSRGTPIVLYTNEYTTISENTFFRTIIYDIPASIILTAIDATFPAIYVGYIYSQGSSNCLVTDNNFNNYTPDNPETQPNNYAFYFETFTRSTFRGNQTYLPYLTLTSSVFKVNTSITDSVVKDNVVKWNNTTAYTLIDIPASPSNCIVRDNTYSNSNSSGNIININASASGTYYLNNEYDVVTYTYDSPAFLTIPVLKNPVSFTYIGEVARISGRTISFTTATTIEGCDGIYVSSTTTFETSRSGIITVTPVNTSNASPAVKVSFVPFLKNPIYTSANIDTSNSDNVDYTNMNYWNSELKVNSNFLGGIVNVNLPSYLLTNNSQYTYAKIRIYNDISNPVTITVASGTFGGTYGNNGSTLTIPDNTWVEVYTNGSSTYRVDVRSPNWTYVVSFSANVDYSNNFNYTDATLRLSATVANLTATLPTATAQPAHSTTIKIYNVGNFNITLSNPVNFIGRFGSGATTWILAPYSYVEMYSNGNNWLVQDKTYNAIYNFNLGSSTTSWTSNNNFNYGIINILPPDIGTTGTAITGTASQTGNVLSVTGLTGGTLSAGSIITINSVRMFIYCQLTTTSGVGSTGTYAVSVNQTVGAGTSFTGFTNTSTVMTGTVTATARDNITTNIPTATINTITSGGNSFNAGTVISGFWNNATYAYILNDGGAGGGIGTYNVSNANIGSVTTQTYFATPAPRINLPDPSASNRGARYTFQNQSHMCVNITTSATNPFFGGLYGQQNNNSTTTTGIATADGRYLLRPQQTVVLESDGSTWNAVAGTTFGGTKLFGVSLTSSTSTTNNVFTNVSTIKTTTMTESNLYGVGVGLNGMIYNQTNNPLVLSITVYVAFNNPVDTTSTALPTRFVRLLRTNTTTNNLVTPTNPVIFSVTAPVITVASPNFAPSATTINVSGSTTFTLLPTEGFFLGIAKSGGASAETTPDVRVEITRLM